MATDVKVIEWKKELKKACGEIDRKIDSLFKAYHNEAAKKPQGDSKLWASKYAPKLALLEKQEDAAYRKLYYKYHTKDNRVKPGYRIKM